MPLQLTSRAAKNPYRITKPKSPFPKRKASAQNRPKSISSEAADEDRLEDTGIPASLARHDAPSDAVALIRHIHARMWTEVPDRGVGMNSTRIAQVLNYRRELPPAASVVHLHALGESSTAVEREVAGYLGRGVLRRVMIPARGTGRDNVGEGLVLVDDWEERVRRHRGLSDGLKNKYVAALRRNTSTVTVPRLLFTAKESSALTDAGFLTAASSLSRPTPLSPSTASVSALNLLSSSGSRFAAGSRAASGGVDAFTATGASSGGAMANSNERRASASQFQFSLPSMGPYLHLLTNARAHLLSLLAKSNRYREAPLDLLRERWDGGIATRAADEAKRIRGELHAILPGQTKKWKQFYGLRFEWVLEECLGAGLVECFQTGSVGLGVRAT